MSLLKNIFFVGMGGMLGSLFRYFVSQATLKFVATNFPVGTFIVNTLGSFFIGVIFSLSTVKLNSSFQLFLATGFCGGFTTFSTFSYETITLFQKGQYWDAFLYVFLSLFIGFFSVYLGFFLGKIFS